MIALRAPNDLGHASEDVRKRASYATEEIGHALSVYVKLSCMKKIKATGATSLKTSIEMLSCSANGTDDAPVREGH